MYLSLITLFQKPGKEGRMDCIHSDFSIIINKGKDLLVIYEVLTSGGVKLFKLIVFIFGFFIICLRMLHFNSDLFSFLVLFLVIYA